MRPNARLRAAIFAAVTALAVSHGAPAFAQSPEEIKAGKQIAIEGLTAYQASQFDKALAHFKQARDLYPSANIIRMLGYSELALEHWELALEALEASMDATVSPLSKDERKEVEAQIEKAMVHIGTINLTSKVKGAKVSVDGGAPRALPLAKPLRLAEGPHKLVVSAPEHLDATSDVKVEPGKTVDLALEPALKPKPKPPPPPPPPPPPKPERKEWVPHQRLAGMGAAGAGVAFGAAALVTMTQWIHWKSLAQSDYDAHLKAYGKGCVKGDPRLCAYDINVTNREADTANRLRNASLGLGVTAGVLAATGAVFYVMAPKVKAPPKDAAPPPAAGPAVSLRCAPVPVGDGGDGSSPNPLGGLGLSCAGVF